MKRKPTNTTIQSRLRLLRTSVRALTKPELEQVAGGDCTDHCPVHECGIVGSRCCAW